MVAPSLINCRRFSTSLRSRVQVAYARAWEALAETHLAEAVRFVRQVGARLAPEEALGRYFRDVAVPPQMQESVRARALIRLEGDLLEADAEAADGQVEPWTLWRPDLMVDALKRRAQFVEETNLCCQLAASLADEAVCITHVRNALAIAELLRDEVPLSEALMHYIRAFELPMMEAQMVYQRSLARFAERHPLLERDEPENLPATVPAMVPTMVPAEPARTIGRPTPMPAYGLRAIG